MKSSEIITAAAKRHADGKGPLAAIAETIDQPEWYAALTFAYECVCRARRRYGNKDVFDNAARIAKEVAD
jgi:hypothetical protein